MDNVIISSNSPHFRLEDGDKIPAEDVLATLTNILKKGHAKLLRVSKLRALILEHGADELLWIIRKVRQIGLMEQVIARNTDFPSTVTAARLEIQRTKAMLTPEDYKIYEQLKPYIT